MFSNEISSLLVDKSIFLDYLFSPRVILPKPLRCTTSSRTFTPRDPTSTASETTQLRFSRKERWSHRKFLFYMYSTLIIKNLWLRQYNLNWVRVVGLIWGLFSGLSLAPTRRSPREVKSFSLAGFPILRRSPSAKQKLPCPLKNQTPHQYF